MKQSNVLEIVGGISAIGALVYWTGRWYKEWYFAQFGFPFEALSFDMHYYLFGSWMTLLVALAGIQIPLGTLVCWWRGGWVRKSISAVVVGLAVFPGLALILRPSWWPRTRCDSLCQEIKTSPDMLLVTAGVVLSLLVLTLCAPLNWASRKRWLVWRRTLRSTRPVAVTTIVGGVLVIACYLFCVGRVLGTYHGQAAIRDGKMGLRWVTLPEDESDGKRWVLVARMSDGRFAVYERDWESKGPELRASRKFVRGKDVREIGDRIAKSLSPAAAPSQ